jgi:hypothetical protein
MMSRMSPVLIVMRLEDMARLHPRQDNTRFCPKCNHRVGIYPSGQAAMLRDPRLGILCNVCNDKLGPALMKLAPGALKEPKESYPRPDAPKRLQ